MIIDIWRYEKQCLIKAGLLCSGIAKLNRSRTKNISRQYGLTFLQSTVKALLSKGKRMKTKLSMVMFIALTITASLSSSMTWANGKFPQGPDLKITPGALCTNSTTYRYPEHIKYCSRDVSSGLKNQIIAQYDHDLGFSIAQMPRGEFKIDHFIPLSIGGANDRANLWPQHKSIYAYSDPLESDLSNLISAARITQAKAVEVMKECKLNLDRCAELGDYLKSLYK